MSIAEKLTTIAENQQRVYDAGFTDGQAQGGGGYDEGYTAGQQAEYDRFWDAYQANGNRMNHNYAFAGVGWIKEVFKPKYSMQPTSASYMFAAMGDVNIGPIDIVAILAERGVLLDFSQCKNMGYCFYQAQIKRIGTIDLSSATDVTSVLNSYYLKTIENLIPPNIEMKTTCFQSELINLTIGGTITKNMNLSRCSELTDASIQSIIDHLADLTGQTAQTITFHATVGGKLTDEQKATITARNWTLVY